MVPDSLPGFRSPFNRQRFQPLITELLAVQKFVEFIFWNRPQRPLQGIGIAGQKDDTIGTDKKVCPVMYET